VDESQSKTTLALEQGGPLIPVSKEFAWVEQLVEFETVSADSNLGLIETVRDYLSGFGLSPVLTYDANRQKANLFASISGRDGERGGTVLSGHTDVVPVEGQEWTSNPFKVVWREGLLYGRGTCDMKGFLGVVLALVPEIVHAKLIEPIHLALSFDEEIGCAGVPLLIEEIAKRELNPHSCIVGEPTGMEVVTGHKGLDTYRCTVQGRATHSALQTSGVSAIEYASRLVVFLSQMSQQFADDGPHDHLFDIPSTTGQAGVIHGGVAVNTIAALCSFLFEFRILPGQTPDVVLVPLRRYIDKELLPRMRAVAPESAIVLERLASSPPLNTREDAGVVRLIRHVTGSANQRKVSFGTEAGLFQAQRINTVVCGPGVITQAHKADEFVSLDHLRRCREMIRAVVKQSTDHQ
jgi:acetylornithine deacetylase